MNADTMKQTLKLGRNRLPSVTRLAESKPARLATAIAAHDGLDRYLRAVNYLAAAQVYLQANPLLEKPLRPEHIRERLLGHWGTCPGINFIYAHLNRLIRQSDASVLLLTGPGHGAAANLANAYLEGSLQEVYPDLTLDRAGLERFVKRFS